jgi:hypothetical protein
LVFLLPKTITLFGFPIIWPWAYIMKVNTKLDIYISYRLMYPDLRNNSTVFEELEVSIVDLTVANAVLLTTWSGASKTDICDRQIHNWHRHLFKYSTASCTLQFIYNLTKMSFQSRHFDYFCALLYIWNVGFHVFKMADP